MTHRRCWSCGRILFPLPNGNLPPHRKPAPKRAPNASHTPLTSPADPWCPAR